MGRLRPILLQMFGDSNMGYTDFPDICSYLQAHTLPDFARTSWLLRLWFPAGNLQSALWWTNVITTARLKDVSLVS